MDINQEKRDIIAKSGNVLVTANPGTGKTLLLAGKYLDLLKKGVPAEKILCLTFTDKAKAEMDTQIIKAITDEKIAFDLAKLNVYTFHSYCMHNIEEGEIVSPNLLRYEIYRYLTENDVLDYSDDTLIDIIVPKIENSIRYLKSFGILPDQINLGEVKQFTEEIGKLSKEEVDLFADHYIKIFQRYEEVKAGYDYADLLIEFLALRTVPKYEFVLVDELQDVNSMEADIALKSAEHFFVVGDKKQAIFGFQGGSILNFAKFNCQSSVLSENFRSTNEILDFSRKYFEDRSADEPAKSELKLLKNPESKEGTKVRVCDCARKEFVAKTCQLISDTDGEVAVIARTNGQLLQLAYELKNKGIAFSSTTYSASEEARSNIIRFIRGVLSSDIADIRNAIFSPFFPIDIQTAFELASQEHLTLEMVYEKSPEFRRLRESMRNITDISIAFRERIFPVAITYGREYLNASMRMNEAFSEAFAVIDNLDLESLTVYLKSADLLSTEPEEKAKITLTTIHKAKGRQFQTVIYLPSKPNKSQGFVDKVVEALLKSKGIDPSEELEEEDLRVNFVAFTRARKALYVLTDKPGEYMNEYSEMSEIKPAGLSQPVFDERGRKAYSLFINGETDKAQELLHSKKAWLVEFVSNYFKALDHLSVSSLKDKAYDYFTEKILQLSPYSRAASTGSEVHKDAKRMAMGEKPTGTLYIDNIAKLLSKIKEKYPELEKAEYEIKMPLSRLIPTEDTIGFLGYVDAIFKNKDEYLIIDWKTDRNTDKDSEHRQQLEAYRRAYSVQEGIPLEKIKVAIGFIALRSAINTGEVTCLLDDRQPAASAFGTFTKHVNLVLGWRKDVKSFFMAMLNEDNREDAIWRTVIEQYKLEEAK